MTGQIVRKKDTEGYGFIRGEDRIERFFHKSSILNARWADIRIGDAVEFEHSEGERGARAEQVLLK
jgi:cold shock CspA family protein